MQAFISHSSEDSRFAGQVAKALASSQIDVWLDRSNIRLGVLLRNELQSAIKKSRVMVLLWSKAAASSRWVSAEILTAFHLKRFIVPCVLDKTRLPLFLAKGVYLNYSGKTNLKALADAVRKAPRGPNPFPSPMIARSADLNEAINTLAAGQRHEVAALGKRDLDSARETHALVNNAMLQAEKTWRLDPMILNLAGFHRKNAYMLKHWDAVQAYQPRRDPLLRRAERLFFRSLFIDPTDHNALDGIASVLMLEGENDAGPRRTSRRSSGHLQQGMCLQHSWKDGRGRCAPRAVHQERRTISHDRVEGSALWQAARGSEDGFGISYHSLLTA